MTLGLIFFVSDADVTLQFGQSHRNGEIMLRIASGPIFFFRKKEKEKRLATLAKLTSPAVLKVLTKVFRIKRKKHVSKISGSFIAVEEKACCVSRCSKCPDQHFLYLTVTHVTSGVSV